MADAKIINYGQPINSSSDNLGVGDSDAIDTITSGTKNIILGISEDNFKLTSGSSNVFAGYKAGEDMSTGSDSVIIGHNAGTAVNNNANVFIGDDCGRVATADENVAIGKKAMENNTGSRCVAVGMQSLDASGSPSFSTAVGHQSLSACTGQHNSALGYQAGLALTSGTDCVFIGRGATTGSATADNQVVLGANASGQGENTVMLGDSTITGLHCYTTTVTNPSDSRIKNNVQDSSLGLDFINALRPVKYEKKHPSEFPEEIREARWSDQTLTDIDGDGNEIETVRPADVKSADWQPKTEYGLIAQEVKAAMDAHGGADWQGHTILPSGMEALGYGALITVLVKSVQELTVRIEQLEGGD